MPINISVPIGSGKNDSLRAKSNQELIRKQLDKIVFQNAKETQSKPEFINLSSYLDKCWASAREAKYSVMKSLYESTLQRRGEYSQDKLKEIAKTSGSTIFMNLTAVKCRAAESWIRDALSPTGNEIYDIKPTSMPDLPPHLRDFITQLVYSESVSNTLLMQGITNPQELFDYLVEDTQSKLEEKANRACGRMKLKISDQLEEAKWKRILSEVISDIITYKAGFLKGPIVRRKPTLAWKEDEQSSTWNAITEDNFVIEYDRIDPFDVYPSPASTCINDGFLIEYHRMTRQDLNELMGVPGYDEESIRLVLQEYGSDGLKNWMWNEELRNEAKDIKSESTSSSPEKTIDTLEFWGDVQGRTLLDWGMTDDVIDDPDKEYHVNAWKIGSYIIKAVINQNPTGKKPYYKASFEDIPGMFWGRGVPELMKDIQDTCNATARALINNLAISSGPQVAIDTNQLASDQDIKDMYPWKIWYFDSDTGQTRNLAPIDFFQPVSNAGELLAVYDSFVQKADDYTGIPAYTYGSSNLGGAGSTATGLSMLMSNAAKGIKYVLANVDMDIIQPSVESLYDFNMMYDTDESTKGDLKVVATGVLSIVAKESMAIRRQEFLAGLSGNPTLMEIIGKKGIANLLREVIATLDMPSGSIVPSEQEIEALDMQKQLFNQIQQMLMAVQSGQMTSDNLVISLVQMLGQQQSAQPVNRGTPPGISETRPDGSRLGGIEASQFVNRPQRPPLPSMQRRV